MKKPQQNTAGAFEHKCVWNVFARSPAARVQPLGVFERPATGFEDGETPP
jgi:hypothetical protein